MLSLSLQVTVMVPKPAMECGPQTFMLPAIQCEQITEQSCVDLPSFQADDVDVTLCTVDLGKPSCQQVSSLFFQTLRLLFFLGLTDLASPNL